MTPSRVFIIGLTKQHIEIRLGVRPPHQICQHLDHVGYELSDHFEYLNDPPYFRTYPVKYPVLLKMKQTRFVGGRVVAVLKRRTWLQEAKTFHFPVPKTGGMVELTDYQAVAFIEKHWWKKWTVT